jgi:hypothetical protein
MSEAGLVTSTDTIRVTVEKSDSWLVDWHLVAIVRTAVLGLSAIGQGIFPVLIRGVIFSPIWGGLLAVVFLGSRSARIRGFS